MNNDENTALVDQIEILDETNTLTDEEIKQVYDGLEEVNPDADKLKAAQEETENVDYSEITEIEPFNQETAETVIPEDVVKQSIMDYNLGFSEEDALSLAKLALEYRVNKDIKLFDSMPSKAQELVRNIMRNINTPQNRNNRISRENAARFFMNNFLNDAELNIALEEFNTTMTEAYNGVNTELNKAFNEAYEEAFNQIDELKETDPEKAARAEAVKAAFDAAKPPFPRLIEWIEIPKSRKIIYKGAEFKFNSETSYFNSKVNVTDVKVPDINGLFDAIKLYDPSRKDIEIKRFIIAICRHVWNQDFTDINNLAYIYRLVDSIYKYKFISTALEDDASKELFGAISAVIDKINSL